MGLQTTYRFRIYPNVAQTEKIEKNFGAWRFVYNYFREKRSRHTKTVKLLLIGFNSALN